MINTWTGLIPFAAVMLAMYIVGLILLRRAYQRTRLGPRCGQCDYDLTGLEHRAVRCPECGGDLNDVGVKPPARGHLDQRRWNVVHLLVLGSTIGALPLWMLLRWVLARI
jgi:hypothetical protein